MGRQTESLDKIANSNKLQELTSLTRMILFASQTATDLDVQFPKYLLELALGAVLEEMHAVASTPTTDGR
ncbi:hypothetical protein SAMN03159496_04483 [Rhizobium sp. NFR07]|uniref:hypothetical protein n=1 Tax=Rhizobium sp. NFR07 TaxID=1566262 RepID=UPI0008F26888|nr:hypothetical protein [Rhizobium sp. NFR07]SFB50952.1 hypothetical protein SAMN03159496_04483 [Rhizobium sp. NFR07]